MVKVHLGLVLAGARRGESGALESVISFGKGVTRLVVHLRVELCFSRQVDTVEVAAWAWELFLFLKIQNEQIIFGSNRINILTLQRAELWP